MEQQVNPWPGVNTQGLVDSLLKCQVQPEPTQVGQCCYTVISLLHILECTYFMSSSKCISSSTRELIVLSLQIYLTNHMYLNFCICQKPVLVRRVLHASLAEKQKSCGTVSPCWMDTCRVSIGDVMERLFIELPNVYFK